MRKQCKKQKDKTVKNIKGKLEGESGVKVETESRNRQERKQQQKIE